MKTIVNYQLETGEIHFIYSPPTDEAAAIYQPPVGLGALVLDDGLTLPNMSHYVVADGYLRLRPQRPSSYHTWNLSGWRWEFNADSMLADMRKKIDTSAGDARSRHITVAPGQEATYSAKYEQAKAFLAASFRDYADYPWIVMEAQATGMSVEDCAVRIKTLGDLWGNVLGPTIEAIRISGKDALDAMQEPTFEQITAHVDQVIADLEAI